MGRYPNPSFILYQLALPTPLSFVLARRFDISFKKLQWVALFPPSYVQFSSHTLPGRIRSSEGVSIFSTFYQVDHILTDHPCPAISSSLLSTFNLYEQFAAAAYCPANNDSPATKLVCTSDACPLVQAATTNTIIEFQK